MQLVGEMCQMTLCGRYLVLYILAYLTSLIWTIASSYEWPAAEMMLVFISLCEEVLRQQGCE